MNKWIEEASSWLERYGYAGSAARRVIGEGIKEVERLEAELAASKKLAQGNFDGWEGCFRRLIQRIQQAQNEKADLEAEVERLENENADLQGKLDAAEKQIERSARESVSAMQGKENIPENIYTVFNAWNELRCVEYARTLRDEFAMAALSGWLANPGAEETELDVRQAYAYADAMLKERAK